MSKYENIEELIYHLEGDKKDAFIAELKECSTVEGMNEVLEKHGVDLGNYQLNELVTHLVNASQLPKDIIKILEEDAGVE